MEQLNKLFVYGTLAPGRPNEHILKNIGGTWETASVRGSLHNAGWGASQGYPAITLDNEGEIVTGLLFCSNKIIAHWSELDEFEGEEYQRVITKVELASGQFEDAFIYELKKP